MTIGTFRETWAWVLGAALLAAAAGCDNDQQQLKSAAGWVDVEAPITFKAAKEWSAWHSGDLLVLTNSGGVEFVAGRKIYRGNEVVVWLDEGQAKTTDYQDVRVEVYLTRTVAGEDAPPAEDFGAFRTSARTKAMSETADSKGELDKIVILEPGDRIREYRAPQQTPLYYRAVEKRNEYWEDVAEQRRLEKSAEKD